MRNDRGNRFIHITKTKLMAEIYSIPDGNGGTPQFTIPIGGMGNGFLGGGNGFNSIADLFGLAIIASMFGWGNGFGGGFGGGNNGGAAFLSNQLANDSGRELIMQAVTNQGEASRTAISTLSTMLGQDFNLVNSAVSNVQNSLNQIANAQGMNALQVINAIQSGDASLAAQFSQCCCENRLSMCQLGNSINQGFAGVQQSIAAKSAADQLSTCQQTYALNDTMNRNFIALDNKLDAMESSRKDREITALTAEVASLKSQNFTTSVVQQAVTPILGQLNIIGQEVEAIKRSQPDTVTLPNNSMTAVPTIWATAVADNIVDRINAALTPTTGGTAGA
jgi:hypothetical protein